MTEYTKDPDQFRARFRECTGQDFSWQVGSTHEKFMVRTMIQEVEQFPQQQAERLHQMRQLVESMERSSKSYHQILYILGRTETIAPEHIDPPRED